MFFRRLSLGITIVLQLSVFHQETWSQALEGHGRFERIAGNPAMGYQQLYEWDLYVSRDTRNYGSSDDVWVVGPSRRLGAPPGESPRGDGFYRVEDLPPGDYSVYINQPDFFASPKVVNDINLRQGDDVVLDVELDVDYSTYFSEGGQWTEWKPTWYQTFVARGTSVRGVSWKMAGAGFYKDQKADIVILEENGESDVTWAVRQGGPTGLRIGQIKST
jgi:hypothetical protein